MHSLAGSQLSFNSSSSRGSSSDMIFIGKHRREEERGEVLIVLSYQNLLDGRGCAWGRDDADAIGKSSLLDFWYFALPLSLSPSFSRLTLTSFLYII